MKRAMLLEGGVGFFISHLLYIFGYSVSGRGSVWLVGRSFSGLLFLGRELLV